MLLAALVYMQLGIGTPMYPTLVLCSHFLLLLGPVQPTIKSIHLRVTECGC